MQRVPYCCFIGYRFGYVLANCEILTEKNKQFLAVHSKQLKIAAKIVSRRYTNYKPSFPIA